MTSIELDKWSARGQESHDVTARDQVLLVLAAIIPFAASTLWYLLAH